MAEHKTAMQKASEIGDEIIQRNKKVEAVAALNLPDSVLLEIKEGNKIRRKVVLGDDKKN